MYGRFSRTVRLYYNDAPEKISSDAAYFARIGAQIAMRICRHPFFRKKKPPLAEGAAVKRLFL